MLRARYRFRSLALVVALVLLGSCGCVSAPPASPSKPAPKISGEQQRVIDLVNQSRAENGRKRLRSDGRLNQKANGWAAKIAGDCKLSHSAIRSGVPAGWRRLAENVGYASSIPSVHRSYLASPAHRKNMLGADLDRVGAGVAHTTCAGYPVVFTVQVFLAEQ